MTLYFFILKPIVMKRIFTLLSIMAAIAVLMVSCSRSQNAGQVQTANLDTAGLAQFQAWKAIKEQPEPKVIYVKQKAAPVKTSNASGNSGTMSSTSTNEAKAKKGWSKSAKYAVIGGVVGATTGAVINKKDRVKGGIIGVILGAGAGYGIGRSQDKKDGRF
jgi:hypothetical protein